MRWKGDNRIIYTIDEHTLTFFRANGKVAVDMEGFLGMIKDAVHNSLVAGQNRAFCHRGIRRAADNGMTGRKLVVDRALRSIEHDKAICIRAIFLRRALIILIVIGIFVTVFPDHVGLVYFVVVLFL